MVAQHRRLRRDAAVVGAPRLDHLQASVWEPARGRIASLVCASARRATDLSGKQPNGASSHG